jgi:hypothetical protein
LEYDSSNKFKEIEPRIYKHIIRPLLEQRTTPHFMMYLGHQYIPSWDKMYEYINKNIVGLKPTMHDNLKKIKTKFYDQLDSEEYPIEEKTGGNILLTECADGISFHDFLSNISLGSEEDSNELIKVLFQMLYTLKIMDEVGLTHYDLHAGNTFLEYTKDKFAIKEGKNQTYIYFINERQYISLPIGKYFARIFDWDFGFKESIETKDEMSSRGKYCKKYGICSIHNNFYDMFHVYSSLMLNYHTPSSIKSFIKISTAFTDMKSFLISCKVDVNKYLPIFMEHGIDLHYFPLLTRETLKTMGVAAGPISRIMKAINEYKKLVNFNENVYSRFEITDFASNVGNRLCKADINMNQCDGPWESTKFPGVMNDITTVLMNFISTFQGDHTFKINSVNELQKQYRPGNYGWDNFVFGITPTLLDQVKNNLTLLDQVKNNFLLSESSKFIKNPIKLDYDYDYDYDTETDSDIESDSNSDTDLDADSDINARSIEDDFKSIHDFFNSIGIDKKHADELVKIKASLEKLPYYPQHIFEDETSMDSQTIKKLKKKLEFYFLKRNITADFKTLEDFITYHDVKYKYIKLLKEKGITLIDLPKLTRKQMLELGFSKQATNRMLKSLKPY